jgi:thiol-disulfide isomerase/thioredoxin
VLLLLLISTTAHAQVLRVGDRATELDSAVDTAGKPFKLAAHRGRWIVMTIGAGWCGPCQDELPVWNRLAGELGSRTMFVTLAIDNDIADGKAFHKRLGLPHMVRAYMPEELSKMVERYGAQSMPTTFVIGPDGVVRYVQMKFDKANAKREYEKLRDALAKLLPKPKPKPAPPRQMDPKPAPRPVPATPPAAPITTVPALVWPEGPHVALWADHWPALPL